MVTDAAAHDENFFCTTAVLLSTVAMQPGRHGGKPTRFPEVAV